MTAKTAAIGRKSAPAELRILNGRGVRKDGQATDSGGRPVEDGPKFTRTAPPKPDYLTPDAEWLWDRVADQMGSIGILKAIDAPSMEVMCETFSRWREAVRQRVQWGLTRETSQGLSAAPWVGIEERASKEFRSWCAEYGITPAAEKNLMVEAGNGGDGQNPF